MGGVGEVEQVLVNVVVQLAVVEGVPVQATVELGEAVRLVLNEPEGPVKLGVRSRERVGVGVALKVGVGVGGGVQLMVNVSEAGVGVDGVGLGGERVRVGVGVKTWDTVLMV